MSGAQDVGPGLGVRRREAEVEGEEALARRFGVSRPVVREGLSRLMRDGLILTRQGSGSFLRTRPAAGLVRPDTAPVPADSPETSARRAEERTTTAGGGGRPAEEDVDLADPWAPARRSD